MHRLSLLLPITFAIGALGADACAQALVTTNTTTDRLVAFSPVDGSLLSADVLEVQDTVQVSAIAVNLEIWISEQTGDRVVRYDHGGNVLGVIGPTFPGGGFDNIRGMAFANGVVYVTNDGTGNGATADSLVCFDSSGNHLQTLPLSNSVSPFGVLPWQGDLLVTGSSNNQDVHRYTTAGVSVGTFHNSTSLNFAHQISPASDGNLWCAGFSSNNVVKLDATNGSNILASFAASGARGVFELQNGNVMWTNSNGVHIYDVGTQTSSQVLAGGCYQLNLIPTGVSNHRKYGTGCHTYVGDRSNLFQLFADVPSAKAALDGNALSFTFAGNGYVANWLPGVANALYLPPSAGATIVANGSAVAEAFTPSAPIPVPGGVASTWTVSSEGVLTAGTPGNQGTASTVTLANTASATGLAWYTWVNQNPTEAGSGKIKWEEVAGVLYVTFDGVELASGSPTVAPSTYQWQIDMASGNVVMLWTSFSLSNSTSDVLVGCTLAGAGITPVSQTLSAVAGTQLQPDLTLVPMTLSASPPPVINPSTLVTYSLDNVPEFAPGLGLSLSAVTLSINPLPGGIDLAGLLTTQPGCNLYVLTWDLILGPFVTATPTSSAQFTFSTPLFSPGISIGAQGVALFDTAFPLANGESGGWLFSNGVLSTTYVQ